MNFAIVAVLISLISLLEVSIYVRAQQQQQADGRFYSSRYDNLDVETLFRSSRLLTNYIDCLLDKKPCPPEGKELKRVLPGALKTACDQCTSIQRKNVLEIIKRLYFQYPDKYIALAEKYDPTGKYTKNFEDWFERNSNFIDESEVTLSNIITTRRKPATKPSTTPSPRPTFSLLTTTRRTTTTPPTTTTTRTSSSASPSTRRSPPLSSSSASSSTRLVNTRQTTTATTLSPLSLFVTSLLPIFATTNNISNFTRSSLRPKSQTSTIFFTATTNFPTSPRTISLMTTSPISTTTTTTPSSTTNKTPQTQTTTEINKIPATQPFQLQPTVAKNPAIEVVDRNRFTPVESSSFNFATTDFVPTLASTTLPRARSSTTERVIVRRPLTTTTTRVPVRIFPPQTSTTTRRLQTQTPSSFVTGRSRIESGILRPQNPQVAPDIIDMFFVSSG